MSLLDSNKIFLLEEIVKKNFSSRYKDSVLGIFWTILRPFLLMLIFTIIFSTIFKKSIENYQVYFLSGWCLFVFFSSAISSSMISLKANKNILLKTPAPKYIFILASIISEFLNLIIMMFLLVFVMIVTRAPFYWNLMPYLIIPIMSLLLLITGLGLILSIFCVYYSDIQHLWSVVSMMLMYASCIFYPIDIVPEHYRQYLLFNPLLWIIQQFRDCVFYGTVPPLLNMINIVLISTIIFVLGVIIFKKYENKVSMKF